MDLLSERDCIVSLATCPGLEPGTLRRLVAGCGSASRVWYGEPAIWKEVCRLSETTVESLQRWQRNITDGAMAESRLLDRSIRVVVRGDADYPTRLHDLPEPPLAIFVKGKVDDLHSMFDRENVVSIVGTRRASSYGLEATRWIAGTIAARGWHVVSGLALGVDVCAHESALGVQGVTSAVLASGVDLCYPVNHRRTYDAIGAAGCLISEYPPGTPVAKHRFPERNRLIAALASVVIVVQAGEKSGALRTAEIALELGRDIYAVPGPITSVHYRGSNRLLADGAAVLLNPEEFLYNHSDFVPSHSLTPAPPKRWQVLYEALEEPLSAGVLATKLGVPVSHVYAGLLELELEGWIERRPGAVYGRKPQNLHPNSAGC
ncbi:DNA-processing protein DprA [Alicyclobacillus mengziensis]|uniref:DNA-processing protein DprA n=1 Tax=Alicyclobacillus mengziensis TaxID=2931921 RepID=A0A9X7W3B6_9BACL|nr:DNA-processing protein DprA [Alicyclobacillus mengziensis]QSO49559.1 DNA-processing protein DprA [Alicyclobacillus mengziensis]